MWRPRRAGVLAALCALRVASGGIVVLAPEASATGRDELLATSLRFFGKRHFERNITGEVVKLYVQQQCDRRILPRPPVLEGAIVVLDDQRGCALETVYANLNDAGAALVLLPWRANPPGVIYNQHDGSRGSRTRGKALLMLEVFSADARTLVAASKRAPAGVVTIHVSPDHNEWVDSFESAYWWGLRAVAASLAFVTYIEQNPRVLCLDAYARMALVSIQEFFGFSYTSFKAQLAIYELGPAAVVLVATFFYASSMKLMPF